MEADHNSMEQKCHNLENKLKRIEDEKNTVLNENEDLQSLLSNMTEAKGVVESKLSETKKEMGKLTDEFQRLEQVCTMNNDHIQMINDKMSDLLNVKCSIQVNKLLHNR